MSPTPLRGTSVSELFSGALSAIRGRSRNEMPNLSQDSIATSRRRLLKAGATSAGALALPGLFSVVTTSTPRDGLALGTYRPGSATAGIVAGSTLTITTNHVPKSNKTYTNLDVRNTVVPGPSVGHVTYKNCVFRGSAARPRSFSSLYTMFQPHKRHFTFIDCTFIPQTPDHRWVGLQGYGFTLLRCDLSNVVDQVEVFNNNGGPGGWNDNTLRNGPSDVVVQQSYFHDSAYFKPGVDPSSNGSHADGIQWQGCTGLVVKGNFFTGQLAPQYQPNYVGGTTTNSAIMMKPDAGHSGGATITRNWFGGGAVSLNAADSPEHNRYITNLGVITYNRFYRDQQYAPNAFVVNCHKTGTHTSMPVTWTGNVYDVNNAAVGYLKKLF
jgi:hypothetical protein